MRLSARLVPLSLTASLLVLAAPARGQCPSGTIVYDTTHVGGLGFGMPAGARFGDVVTLAGTARFICEISIFAFGLSGNFTAQLFTACPCGGGVAIGNPVTISSGPPEITFPFPDVMVPDTVAVAVIAEAGGTNWFCNEAATVGTETNPGANNCGTNCNFVVLGCSNIYSMTIRANLVPVELESFTVADLSLLDQPDPCEALCR